MKKKLPPPRPAPALFDAYFRQEAAKAALERAREAREQRARALRGGRKPRLLVK